MSHSIFHNYIVVLIKSGVYVSIIVLAQVFAYTCMYYVLLYGAGTSNKSVTLKISDN